jgi:hypothetical protein
MAIAAATSAIGFLFIFQNRNRVSGKKQFYRLAGLGASTGYNCA